MANVTYTFKPKLTTQSVFWHDPLIWIGGVVPDDPNADVVIPPVTLPATGSYVSDIAISTGEAFAAGSLDIDGARLMLDGELSVVGNVRVRDGATVAGSGKFFWASGTLNAGSLVNEGQIFIANGTLAVGSLLNEGGDIQASGTISVSGLLTNESSITGRGTDGHHLTLTASSLVNNGTLATAIGNLSVFVDAGGFANLTGSTLTGGTYSAYQGTLSFNVGSLIETTATDISLTDGADILSYDPASGHYVSIQSSLHSIAASGTLSLAHQAFEWGNLSIDGLLTLSNQATLLASQLTLGTGGRIAASGVIQAPIANAGIIEAGSQGLVIAGPVTGSGKVVASAFLEASGPFSQAVEFANRSGTLFIDDPTSFTGTIAPRMDARTGGPGDAVVLYGHAFDDLQGYSYSGDATGGVLLVHDAAGTTALDLVGEFNTGSFQLAVGPQAPTSLPSLKITVGGITKLASDTGDSATDNITSNPTITGNPAALIQLEIDGTLVVFPNGTNYLHGDSNGLWSYTPTGLADGTHTVVARDYLTGPHASVSQVGTSSLTFTLDHRLATHGDAYVVLSQQSLSVAVVDGVLANDLPAAPATVTLSSGPAHGALQLESDGSFAYTPAQGFTGIDVFAYHAQATDGTAGDDQALIYVVPVALGATTTLDLVALSAEEQIAATYVSFFGRAADTDGFDFWVDQFSAGAGTQSPATLFANIASSFGISLEAKTLYPFLANPAGAGDAEIGTFLDGVYDNLFNRSTDAAGLAYWTGQVHQALAAGQFVGSVLVNIMSGAQNTAAGQDITTLMGKVAVSLEYVHEQQQHGMAWAGASDVTAATALLDPVTADPQTVLAGLKNADTLVAQHA